MSNFTDSLVNICRDEYARWDNGKGRETHGTDQAGVPRDYFRFVGEYWKSIGINNLDGRTVQGGIRPAWSSAFVSYCVRKAGAGERFKYTQAHCHYIAPAMAAASAANPDYGYVAMRAETYTPRPGDIVCAGRQYAKNFDYDKAAMIYTADSFYPSHGDIVIDVTPSHVVVIGGNIIDNVDMKRLARDPVGPLKRRTEGEKSWPWITVLRCLL
jgi:hypothetical protein